MDRRQFLNLSGTATAALIAGCGGGSTTPTISPVVKPIDPDWKGLATSLNGQLVRPTDPSYVSASVISNRQFDIIKPSAIIQCASVSDVKTGLAFVRRNGFLVTPRCGGHSWGGSSTTTGVVLNVTPMNTIEVNSNGTAKIGAGARLAQVYDTLISKGVCIPSGTCLTVGISGITMGGGIGILDRQFGLTCDNLLAAEVVTTDGRAFTCDETHEPELFWAIRGGGGGNFCVATSFTFKTHPIADIVVARANFSFQDFAQVFHAWQRWPETLPDHIWAQIYVEFWPTGTWFVVTAYCLGSIEEMQLHWNDFLIKVNATPFQGQLAPTVTQRSYRDVAWDMCAGYTLNECSMPYQSTNAKKQRYDAVLSSDFFNTLIPDAGVNALINAVNTHSAAGGAGSYIFDHMGGAISRIASDATAFYHRRALFSVEYATSNNGAVYDTTFPNRMRTIMQTWSSGGAYVNYLDPLLKDWEIAYYGQNLARLRKVKSVYDPTRIFNMAQGI